VSLQSSPFENKSLKELYVEMNRLSRSYKPLLSNTTSVESELKLLSKAKVLEDKLLDKEKNGEMNKLIEYYSTYFDEESGNTRQEGIGQLQEYLEQELEGHKATYMRYKFRHRMIWKVIQDRKAIQAQKDIENQKDVEDKKDIENRKLVEENPKTVENQKAVENQKDIEENKKTVVNTQNTFFAIFSIIPINIFTTLRILLTIFSLIISFNFIDFNWLILYLPKIAIPTILTTIVLFVWEYYRLYSKVRKYCKVGKLIYMFCEKYIKKLK